MAKKPTITNPEIYQKGLDIAREIIHNAPKQNDMAEILVSRFRDLLDSYSIGITQAAKDFLNEQKAGV